MPSFYALLLAVIAATVAAKTNCKAIQSSFQMVANTTDGPRYSQLLSPCTEGPCSVFFNVDPDQAASNFTFYSINATTGVIGIVSSNQPISPEGLEAFSYGGRSGSLVDFATPDFEADYEYPLMHCALLPETDGSCTVKCVGKTRYNYKKVSGDHIVTSDRNRWIIGKGTPEEDIVIKAIAS